MKFLLNTKSLYLSKGWLKYIALVTFAFVAAAGAGIFVINYLKNGMLNENFSKTTENIESIWKVATVANQETMEVYLKHYIMDEEVLRLFEMAADPEKQSKARLRLYRYLYPKYKQLRDRLSARQLNFVFPDNTVFIRFHVPHKYGDDLTGVRPSVVYVNTRKEPFTGIEVGKVTAGFRYIFPVFSKDGKYLGCVEISKPFEAIRRMLKQIDRDGEYVLLIHRSEIEKKVFYDFKGYYKPFAGLNDWLVEDTTGILVDAPEPISRKYIQILSGSNLKQILETTENITSYVSSEGMFYKITAIKFGEKDQKVKPLVLLRVSPAPDIASIVNTFYDFEFIYLFLLVVIFAGLMFYFKKNYAIKIKNKELEIITSTMGSGLAILDTEGIVKFINNAALNMLGFSKEEILGSSFHEAVHKHAGSKENCPIFLSIKSVKNYDADDMFETKDGRHIDVSIRLRPLFIDDNHIGSILVFDDITERKQMEKKLFMLATVDHLTGLYNRRYTVEAMNKFKNQSDRYGYPLSVMMLDVDNFKKINDTFGHETGDEVLKTLAKTIKENIRASDIPSRWGGEEFLVVLPNTDLDGAVNLAERIREAVSRVEVGPVKRFTISVGVAQYDFGETIDDLVIKADRGLYEAKRSGKNRVVAVSV